jgi:hypothetical protein
MKLILMCIAVVMVLTGCYGPAPYGPAPYGGGGWYWGQPGHWQREHNDWQFRSEGLVCNNQGRDCRPGRNLPSNGEGMVSPNDPNFYWGCDSEGHHCRWVRRPRY